MGNAIIYKRICIKLQTADEADFNVCDIVAIRLLAEFAENFRKKQHNVIRLRIIRVPDWIRTFNFSSCDRLISFPPYAIDFYLFCFFEHFQKRNQSIHVSQTGIL